jgi:hypothetical protein
MEVIMGLKEGQTLFATRGHAAADASERVRLTNAQGGRYDTAFHATVIHTCTLILLITHF